MRINYQLLVGILCGGLGGSIFSWWATHPRTTILAYTVTTTTLGANLTVKGLIPNLKVQIGDEEVPVIHTHTLEFGTQSGPFAESAEILIKFPTDVRIFGRIMAEVPSSLHHMSCRPLSNGTQCTMGPFALGKGTFRVALATDHQTPPTAFIVARGVDLLKAEGFLASSDSDRTQLLWSALASMIVG